MNKRPLLAATLFGALVAGGILTMFSQAGRPTGALNGRTDRSRRVSLNPGTEVDTEFGDVLPGVIEQGVESHLERLTSDEEKNAEAKPRTNILRLR